MKILSVRKEPYFFATQAKQDFFVEDPRTSKWNIALSIFPIDMYKMSEAVMDDGGTL